jgi:hypothetical protein
VVVKGRHSMGPAKLRERHLIFPYTVSTSDDGSVGH